MIDAAITVFKEETQKKEVAEWLKLPRTDEQEDFLILCFAFKEIEKFQPKYYNSLQMSLYSSLIEGVGYRLCKSEKPTKNYCYFFKELLNTKSKIKFLSLWNEKYKVLRKSPNYPKNISIGVVQILEDNIKRTSLELVPLCWKESCRFEGGECYSHACRLKKKEKDTEEELKKKEKELNEFVSLLAYRYYDYYRSKFTHNFNPENTLNSKVKGADGGYSTYLSVGYYEEFRTGNKITFRNQPISEIEDMIRNGLLEYLKKISNP